MLFRSTSYVVSFFTWQTYENRVSKTRFINKKILKTLSLKRNLTSLDRIRSQREKESNQIRERETRSERGRPDQRPHDLGRVTQAARLGSRDLGCATQAVRPGLGGPGRAAWVARPGLREPQVLRGLGRATPSRTRPGARATQVARLARPEVRCGLGGFDFFWVFSSSL